MFSPFGVDAAAKAVQGPTFDWNSGLITDANIACTVPAYRTMSTMQLPNPRFISDKHLLDVFEDI